MEKKKSGHMSEFFLSYLFINKCRQSQLSHSHTISLYHIKSLILKILTSNNDNNGYEFILKIIVKFNKIKIYFK
jgi:hypothetical protein